MTNLMKRGIIVSCQALSDEPLHGGDTMVKMAKAAQLGGAIGIRANGVNDIAGIKNVIDLPLIGLYKHTIPGSSIFITPTINEVKAIVDAGADIVAMDVTNREDRYEQARELLEYVHGAGRLAMADISTYEEGIQAEQMGFDYDDLIPGYTGTPIKELVSKRYELPVHVDNDVNVLALAEAVFGAGRKARNIVCLALGTGVGGAIIMDGVLVHGSRGGAGEIGHLSVDRHGPRCICGNVGCLELYASGTGIAHRYREKKEASGLSLTGSEGSTVDVVARWMDGEPEAIEVMGEAIATLGSAITSLIHVLNPEVIVIGGGIAGLGEPLFAPLREYVANQAMPSMSDVASIVPAELGESSNMVGAAIQVWIYNQ